MNKDLFETEISTPLAQKTKRPGPPNRMNDLPYREWMKFQKSFFRLREWGSVIEECVTFFTKEYWPDERRISESLVVGFPKPFGSTVGGRRIQALSATAIGEVYSSLETQASHKFKFDFVLVNLRGIAATDFNAFLSQCPRFFDYLRTILYPSRYCAVVCDWIPGAFPIPWAIGKTGRSYLKLRDEKIAIDDASGSCHYILFFQADDDAPLSEVWHTGDIQIAAEPPTTSLWTMPKSPPRKADEILHPAKFPEKLVNEFIDVFSRSGETVLDPMMGTGSALIAAMRNRRNAIGIELNPTFVEIARNRANAETPPLLEAAPTFDLFQGDARNVDVMLKGKRIDYCVTSPPYWSMLSNEGSENQKARRERNLQTVYSDSEKDVGNIADYGAFVGVLGEVYEAVGRALKSGGFLSVVVKNVKRNHIVYPLAWDLVRRLAGKGQAFEFVANTLWCQDDVGIKPFAVGIYWVSNTLHTYCLHFRKR